MELVEGCWRLFTDLKLLLKLLIMTINKEDSQDYELYYRVRGEILGHDIHPFPLNFKELNKLIESGEIKPVLKPECIHIL